MPTLHMRVKVVQFAVLEFDASILAILYVLLFLHQVTLITDLPGSRTSGMTSASLIDPSLQRDLLLNQQRVQSLNPFEDDM